MYLKQIKSPIAGKFPIKVPIIVHSFTGILIPVANEVRLIIANTTNEITVFNKIKRRLFLILTKKYI